MGKLEEKKLNTKGTRFQKSDVPRINSTNMVVHLKFDGNHPFKCFGHYECRYNERLRVKVEGSTRLTYTGFLGRLIHLKISNLFREENYEDHFLISMCVRVDVTVCVWS